MISGEFESAQNSLQDGLTVPSELVDNIQEILTRPDGSWVVLRDLMQANPAFSPQILSIQHMDAYSRRGRAQRTLMEKVSIFRAVTKDKPGFVGNPNDEIKLMRTEIGIEEPTDQELLVGILSGRVYVGYFDNEK